MKYPYIGEGRRGSIVLFSADSVGFAIEHENRVVKSKWGDNWDERAFTNITREYLSNTWGVVESKEHAEFIIELAENAGFAIGIKSIKAMCFEFSVDSVFFYEIPSEIFAHNDESKQITIPLPPKAKTEKSDFSDLPKHFDCRCNKCGGKCCAGLCDEWPQVGDEVLAFDIDIHDGRKGNFIGKNKHGVPIVELESGSVILLGFEGKMEKPKSKQDLLIEELQTKLCNNNAADNYILACDIINGEIEGLSYE